MTTLARPGVHGVQVRGWSTPRRLRAFLVAILALSLGLFLVGEGALARARAALKTVGHDAAPSIISAEAISASLADLDANAANYLLGNALQAQSAFMVYEEQRVRVTKRLVEAAENITYGDTERVPILSLFENTGRYMELIAQARTLRDRDDKRAALDAYRTATTLMHKEMLPTADALDHANTQAMDATYDDQSRASTGSESLAVLAGFALVAVLAWTQLFLLRRMRRILNPALAVATILAIVFSVVLVRRFGTARDDLRVAKDDAFESIHLLWRARATAYDANGDESRFLLDRANANAHEQAFRTHVGILTSQPEVTARAETDMARGRGELAGLFGAELGNVTFPGERGAAVDMIHAFSTYYAIDGKIRALEAAGKHDAAVALCVGSGAAESNAAFDAFDQALDQVLAINKAAFDKTIDDGDQALRTAEWLDPLFAMAIAALGFLGLRPRLKEYAA